MAQPVSAQTTPRIDALKDSFYTSRTAPEHGRLRISSSDYLPLSGPMPDSDSDASADIWAAWDEQYFYLYAEIQDDTVLVNKPNRPSNDCLELKFDPDPTLKSWAGILNVRLSALDSAEAENINGVDNLYPDPYGQGVLPPEASSPDNYARRRMAGGYAVELRLAWEWFRVDVKAVRPEIGTAVGVAITIHDNDGVAPSPVMRDGSIQWSVGMADEVWLVPQLLGTMRLAERNEVQFVRANLIDPAASPGVTYFSRARYASQRRSSLGLENWRYHPGDSLAWASPDWDDRSWEITWAGLSPPRMPRSGWNGIGWFRIRIVVDTSLVSTPLGLILAHFGASEVYLDGRLLYAFGKVGRSTQDEEREFILDPHLLIFPRAGPHTLAVRYSNLDADKLSRIGARFGGFDLSLDREYERAVDTRREIVRLASIYQGLFVMLPGLLTLFHLLLFMFYPSGRENLFFALSMLCWSVIASGDLSGVLVSSVDLRILMARMMGLVIPAALLFGLMTFYLVFPVRIPRHALLFIGTGVVLGSWAWFDPASLPTGVAIYIFIGLCTLEMIRVVIRAGGEVRRRRWVMAAGFSVLMLAVFCQILVNFGVIPMPFGSPVVYMWGLLVLSIAVSVDLSRTFARTNRELAAQLAQVQELSQKTLEQERRAREEEVARQIIEADNARKTRELEEAKRIQLSMLPKVLPRVPGLDIAVYTQPATEVGGDYYDFHYADDGTLTIAVGDATGHGMKAGTMVATIKGMFSSQRGDIGILTFFQQCSSTIRDMRLGNLYMGMTLARLRAGTMTVSSAGMPPVLVYRATSGLVDAMVCRGMPLGGPVDFPYVEKETRLGPGDTVLLMSDGLAELFNEADETFDYQKVTETFSLIGHRAAGEIIELLTKEGDIWRGDRPQNDDITFVVVKVTGHS